jgi:hypothetical protein
MKVGTLDDRRIRNWRRSRANIQLLDC